jgi:hypothetical protein
MNVHMLRFWSCSLGRRVVQVEVQRALLGLSPGLPGHAFFLELLHQLLLAGELLLERRLNRLLLRFDSNPVTAK